MNLLERGSAMNFVVGIDGGGTKTAAMIMDSSGRVCGSGEGGPSTFGVVPAQITRASIQAAVAAARQMAGLPPEPFAAAFLGLGNVVSEKDRAAVRAIAITLDLAAPAHIGVDHDCRVALAGGLAGRPGIVQIAGTGTSTFGMNAAGETWRAGGWGPLIDDEGSSYWLGIQAMRAAALAQDGRGPATHLTVLVAERLQLGEINDLMNRLYAAEMSRTEIAALAPLVYQAAEQTDAVALRLIQQGCAAMADCVLTVARKLGMQGAASELAITGGMTKAREGLFIPLEQAVRARLPHCKVVHAEQPPVYGAALLALQQIAANAADAANVPPVRANF